jgi:hypothetical protein
MEILQRGEVLEAILPTTIGAHLLSITNVHTH